jgi:hypothetical protein
MAHHQHYTRSKPDSQSFASMSASNIVPSSQQSSTSESNDNDTIASQEMKTDTETYPDDQKQSFISHLQQLSDTQKYLAEDNRCFKECLQRQQTTIDTLTELLLQLKSGNHAISPTTDTSLDAPSSILTSPPIPSTTDQATKQLRSKQLTQLLEATPFSGSRAQDVVDWIHEFNRKCDDIKLDDKQRLSIARGLMKNDAKLWTETYQDILTDWTEFQRKLIAYFQLASGIDRFSFGQQLYNRQQQLHESAIHYFHDVMRLCSKVDIDMKDKTRLEHLYRGLRPEAKIYIKMDQLQTPDGFLQELVRHEQLQKNLETQPQQVSTTVTYPSNTPSRKDAQAYYSNYSMPHQQRNVSRTPSNSWQPSYPSNYSSYRRDQQHYSASNRNHHLNE